jgi:DNA-binding SARP family transcriptional activator
MIHAFECHTWGNSRVTIAATGRQKDRRDAGVVPRASLRLVAEFQLLIEGSAVTLPHSVERIVAFLGMHRSPVNRPRLAASLWPDVPDHRANGDLRSALWRLRRVTGVLRERDNRLALAPEVDIDIVELSELTQSLIDEPSPATLGRLPDLVSGHDILPGWDEEWLVVERERYRLLRLRAMERSAEALLAAGDHAAALDAALACAATEPYRESAHRLVIQIHIAEGNNAEAFRSYQRYRSLLSDELGILPSPIMDALIAPITSHGAAMTVR